MAISAKLKNSTVSKNKTYSFFGKHWWKIGISLLFLTSLVFFGYNKYLDRQNVSDMKLLLSDFEKLKTDVEAEIGEQLYIEATCGNVGKFATSYACSLLLKPVSGLSSDALLKTIVNLSTIINSRCSLASKDYKIEDSSKDYYICTGIHVRDSNINNAVYLFNEYDTSPGSAL